MFLQNIFYLFLILFVTSTGVSFAESRNAEGVHKEYFADGSVHAMWFVADGFKEGAYKKYYADGQIEKEYNYVEDKLEGIQRKYFAHGEIEREWYAKDGLKQDEEWVNYNDGTLHKILRYKNNRLDGKQDVYRQNGALYKVRNYKNGKLHGVQKGFWLNGNVSTMYFYENGELNGDYKTFSPAGEIIQTSTYKKGKLISSTLDKSKQINFSELDYKYKGHAVDESFYDTTKLRSAVDYKNSILNGLVKKFYHNGGVKSITHYIEGLKDGLQIVYYNTGETQSRLYYVEDELDGIQEFFYRNGVLKAKEYYKQGVMHGLQEYYYNNGVLIARKVFQQGGLIRLQKFLYENGVLRTVEEYIDGKVQEKQAGEEEALETFARVEEMKDLVIPIKKVEKYESGSIQSEFEVNERAEVFQRTYFENGQLHLDVQWDGSSFIFYVEYDEAGDLVKQELVSIYKHTNLIQELQFCQMLKGKYTPDGCSLPTEDAFQECFDSIQCQGQCIAYEAIPGVTAQGTCSSWTGDIEGCYSAIQDGKALEPKEDCEK